MKKVILFLAGLAFSIAAPAADDVRLALWVTDRIGVNSGIECYRTDSAAMPLLPATTPTLTEHDVTAWNPTQGRWTLDPARFAGTDAEKKLVDRCFILAIDGQPVSSGVVLSEYSARLTGFPTINVMNRNNVLDLQLLSSNHGPHMRLIHIDALKDVLSPKPAPGK